MSIIHAEVLNMHEEYICSKDLEQKLWLRMLCLYDRVMQYSNM